MREDLWIDLGRPKALSVGVEDDKVRLTYHVEGHPQWVADLTPLQALTLSGYLQLASAKPFGAERVSVTVETSPKAKTP